MDDFKIVFLACIAGLTLSSMFKSMFYYRHEANRQIKLAEHGFDPRKKESDDA